MWGLYRAIKGFVGFRVWGLGVWSGSQKFGAWAVTQGIYGWVQALGVGV